MRAAIPDAGLGPRRTPPGRAHVLMNRQFQYVRAEVLRLGATVPLCRRADFVPELYRFDTPLPQGLRRRVFVLHQNRKEQRADTLRQVVPQQLHTARQLCRKRRKFSLRFLRIMGIIKPLQYGVTDGRHGNVTSPRSPPDVADRDLPHIRRPQQPAKTRFIPNKIRPVRSARDLRLPAPVRRRGRWLVVCGQRCSFSPAFPQKIAVLHQQTAVRHGQSLIEAERPSRLPKRRAAAVRLR